MCGGTVKLLLLLLLLLPLLLLLLPLYLVLVLVLLLLLLPVLKLLPVLILLLVFGGFPQSCVSSFLMTAMHTSPNMLLANCFGHIWKPLYRNPSLL